MTHSGGVDTVGEGHGVALNGDAWNAPAVVQHEVDSEIPEVNSAGRCVPCKSARHAEALQVDVLTQQEPEVVAMRACQAIAEDLVDVGKRSAALRIVKILACQSGRRQGGLDRHAKTRQQLRQTAKGIYVDARHDGGCLPNGGSRRSV